MCNIIIDFFETMCFYWYIFLWNDDNNKSIKSKNIGNTISMKNAMDVVGKIKEKPDYYHIVFENNKI